MATEILKKSDKMVIGATYEMSRIKLTHLWGACKMESLGMSHSSSSRAGGYRATAEAKRLFGWPQNVSKKETFRRVNQLRQNVVDGDHDGMYWEYPIPILEKED